MLGRKRYVNIRTDGALALTVTAQRELFSDLELKHVVDALDVDRSDIAWSVDGGIKRIDVPAWRGERLTDPLLFRIPQIRYTIWATPAVAHAYEQSGCNGLSFGPRGHIL
jgi:hypothetical protein